MKKYGGYCKFLLSFFLVIGLIASVPVMASENSTKEEKEILLDGVVYTLNLNDQIAVASITALGEYASGYSLPVEVTIHNEINYEGKNYKVQYFDANCNDSRIMQNMVIRNPKSLSFYQKNLKKITIEKGIFYLNFSFSNYLALEEVVFEDQKDMEDSGMYFYHCPNLKDIYVPADVDVCPRLRDCPNTKVIFAPNHPYYKEENGSIYSKDGKILYDVSRGSSIYRVKSAVQKVNDFAFYGNDIIKKVYLPSSVKGIGTYVFCNMQKLKFIKFSKNMKRTIQASYNFYLCDDSPQIKTLTFPKNIKSIKIWSDGKKHCKLKKIFIQAKELKGIKLSGVPKTCKVYVKNNTVKRQVYQSHFKGKIIVKK